MITHRCENSLKNKASIRYSKRFNSLKIKEDFSTWRLFKLEFNNEYEAKYLNHISEIFYCPFCGLKLNKKGDEKSEF